jgi:hypothetical protein
MAVKASPYRRFTARFTGLGVGRLPLSPTVAGEGIAVGGPTQKGDTMKSIKQALIPVLGLVAVTAAVSAPAQAYTTPNAQLGSTSTESSSGNDFSSPNAILGQTGAVRGERVEVSSPNAVLGESGVVRAGSAPGSSPSGSPNAILGAGNVIEPTAEPVSTGGSGGFDWDDALIGAGTALTIAILGSVAMVVTRRRRHPTPQASA